MLKVRSKKLIGILISLTELVIVALLICSAIDRKYTLKACDICRASVIESSTFKVYISFRVLFLQINDFIMFHAALILFFEVIILVGTAVAQWLRCSATNRKVAGSIPDGVIGIFH